MTTVAHPNTGQVRHEALRDVVRRLTAALATLIRTLRAELSDIAAAGQLGPDAEVEVGRWTGTRV